MKPTIYKLGSTLLIILLIVVLSCRKDMKDVSPDPAAGKVSSFSELKAASDFNWKTTQNVDLSLSASVKSSLVVKSASGVIFHKALLNGQDVYNISITIPNYMSELTFLVNGTPYVLKIENNRIVHSF